MANLITQWLDPNNFAILRDKFNAVVNVLSGGDPGQVYNKYGTGDGESQWSNFMDMFPTGQPWDTYETDLSVAPFSSKWVARDGKTLGSSSSTADLKGTQYEALFKFLWNKFANAECPVTGGRGADADEDWAANKKIQLMDDRGVFDVGYDDRSTDPSNGIWDADYNVMGKLTGEKLVSLTAAQNGPHNHGLRVQNSDTPDEGLGMNSGDTSPESYSTSTSLMQESGEGEGHNNIPPARSMNKIIKL